LGPTPPTGFEMSIEARSSGHKETEQFFLFSDAQTTHVNDADDK
jgi:hypothetical protein